LLRLLRNTKEPHGIQRIIIIFTFFSPTTLNILDSTAILTRTYYTKEDSMKKVCLIFTMIVVFTFALSAQENHNYRGKDNDQSYYRIQQSLDRLLIMADKMPDVQKYEIIAHVIEMKKNLMKLADVKDPFKFYSDKEMASIQLALTQMAHYPGQKAYIESLITNARFTSAQVIQLLSVIKKSADRRDAAQILMPTIVDMENIKLVFKFLDENVGVVEEKKIYTDAEIDDLIKKIRKQYRYSAQKLILQRYPEEGRMTMAQIKNVLRVIPFPSDKKDALQYLLPNVADPQNVDILFDDFWTPGDQEYINSLLKK